MLIVCFGSSIEFVSLLSFSGCIRRLTYLIRVIFVAVMWDWMLTCGVVQMWISKKEYDEHGPGIVEKRCK